MCVQSIATGSECRTPSGGRSGYHGYLRTVAQRGEIWNRSPCARASLGPGDAPIPFDERDRDHFDRQADSSGPSFGWATSDRYTRRVLSARRSRNARGSIRRSVRLISREVTSQVVV
jgi:hypothetical protein